MIRRIVTTAAALALAIGGAIGFGAGTAQAADGCTGWYHTVHGASYELCIENGNRLHWYVNKTGSSTDERFYVSGNDFCGNTYSFNWNDWSQSGYNNAWWTFPCNVQAGALKPTESSVSWDGPLLTIYA
ncbi:hypothetical protein ACVB8X_40850 [Streptomyces sp. NRAIS4]